MPRTNVGSSARRCAEHNFYDLRMRFPTTGDIWFVDSGAASGGNGRSPEQAVTTIDAAINLASANNGDIIIVMEGHAESITGAAGIALDVAGVTIVGLGRGRNRPVITFTTAVGASFDISAASCHVENLALVCNIDDQTAMINVTAADVTIRNCEFQISDATYDADIGILASDAGDRLTVDACNFHATGNTTAAVAISFGACDNSHITGNTCFGYWGTAGAITNAAAAAVNLNISRNIINNRTADGNNKAIVLHGSSVGIVSDNRIAIIDSTCPAPITAAAAFVSHNYSTGAVGVTASALI